MLHVELTNACNLECPMCPRTTAMDRKVGYIPVPLVEKIAAEAAGQCEFVTLHAWGESILHPQFDRVIQIFRAAGLRTLLSTNANLLNEKRRERLLASGLDFLIFSLDAVNEDTYQKLRTGGNFQETVQNVESFLRQARERNVSTFCVLQLIYMSVNKDEARLFKRKWQALGAHVWLKPFSIWNGDNDDIRKFHPDLTRNRYQENLCDWPWRQFVIHWNGDVVPCCMDYNGAVKFGNVQDETLTAIWTGERMQAFRAAHIKGRGTIDFCKNCQHVSLGPVKQATFILFNYLAAMKIQTRFENYFRKKL